MVKINPRLSCTGLLRESVNRSREFPSLVKLCIRKIRCIRNEISGLHLKDISIHLIYMIYQGCTCYELLQAETKNPGIDTIFKKDNGKLWESLWETAVRIKFNSSPNILNMRRTNESFRNFFLRYQEENIKKFEKKLANSDLKSSLCLSKTNLVKVESSKLRKNKSSNSLMRQYFEGRTKKSKCSVISLSNKKSLNINIIGNVEQPYGKTKKFLNSNNEI
ncbi:hypothetical protein cand_002110 [Cryptosporidium andersoni]|uniref:Uncharacterized protein n=1 Tax=Cryptosporidium andersoni TaxID=117008 RepID=A0A1J4MSN6_9CRYT|nr:hypothetical protein cand_002110 [Cryptosporidium andersoni]